MHMTTVWHDDILVTVLHSDDATEGDVMSMQMRSDARKKSRKRKFLPASQGAVLIAGRVPTLVVNQKQNFYNGK